MDYSIPATIAKSDTHQFVNKPVIARYYSVSARTIDNWMQWGLIPFIKIRGVVRFRLSEVDAALARFEVKSRTSPNIRNRSKVLPGFSPFSDEERKSGRKPALT